MRASVMAAKAARYGNLVVNSVAAVEVGGETFKARAKVAGGTERDRLFAAHATAFPQFNDYQQRTSRVIPVALLKRLARERPPHVAFGSDEARLAPTFVVALLGESMEVERGAH